MEYLGWLFVGLLIGGGTVFFAIRFIKKTAGEGIDSESVVSLLTSHFKPVSIENAGRHKLVCLYSEGVRVADEVVAEIVQRTEGVSPAFIKELMRRSVQFHIERNGIGEISKDDVTSALDEMLAGGLNSKLLGAIGFSNTAT